MFFYTLLCLSTVPYENGQDLNCLLYINKKIKTKCCIKKIVCPTHIKISRNLPSFCVVSILFSEPLHTQNCQNRQKKLLWRSIYKIWQFRVQDFPRSPRHFTTGTSPAWKWDCSKQWVELKLWEVLKSSSAHLNIFLKTLRPARAGKRVLRKWSGGVWTQIPWADGHTLQDFPIKRAFPWHRVSGALLGGVTVGTEQTPALFCSHFRNTDLGALVEIAKWSEDRKKAFYVFPQHSLP